MEDFNFEKQLIFCQEDLMKAALILLPNMDDAKELYRILHKMLGTFEEELHV